MAGAHIRIGQHPDCLQQHIGASGAVFRGRIFALRMAYSVAAWNEDHRGRRYGIDIAGIMGRAAGHAPVGIAEMLHRGLNGCHAASKTGAWVHAYLHRLEGDNSNAGHWYRRAGKPHSSVRLDDEWEEIASALLHEA